MEMYIVDAGGRFARKARSVVIVDCGRLAICKVEPFDFEAIVWINLIADVRIDGRRTFGSDAVVFDERPRTEIAITDFSVPGSDVVDGERQGRHTLHGARDALTDGVEITKPGTGVGKIRIDRQPVIEIVVISEFKPRAAAGPPGRGGSRIPLKDEFRVEIQHVPGQRAL